MTGRGFRPLALLPYLAQCLIIGSGRRFLARNSYGQQAMGLQLELDEEGIAAFCRRHHIRRLAFFGSVLREDFGSDSDVDVLVEFEPGHVPGLAFLSMEAELSEILGRKVDLNTLGFLSPYLREKVLREVQVQYAAP